MSLCLITAAKTAKVVTTSITLIWTHSVEKTRWEEQWRIAPAGLTLVSAKVKGSGAGMEPPPHARKEGPWYVWNNDGQPLPQLTLARSGATDDWRLCTSYECLPMDILIGRATGPVTLAYCP